MEISKVCDKGAFIVISQVLRIIGGLIGLLIIDRKLTFSAWYCYTISGIKEVGLWGIGRIKTGELIRKQRNIVKMNIKLAFIVIII